ncbi:hypothetical protein F4678DRAFT_482817 [Xylaria arbuscula]|nr:hypothetical protein F4678DRAFT_482817 [Xylaria arbuscula]
MSLQAWKCIQKSEGYVSLTTEGQDKLSLVLHSLKRQRPWHSKIRLPLETDEVEGPDFCHVESHDVDCVLILLRMLISLGLPQNQIHNRNSLTLIAKHNFGWDRRSDYMAKGMLVSKLFPGLLDKIDDLRSELTFDKLMKHPGIGHIIFTVPEFCLKDPQLITYDSESEPEPYIESIETCSLVDMVDENEVKWDGLKPLGQAVADQSYYENRAPNSTKFSRRYCTVPNFIRVTFKPHLSSQRHFGDVQRFKLTTKAIQYEDDETSREIVSNSTYTLCAAVKMDPKDPIGNPAEIRVYRFDGKMTLPAIESETSHRDVIGRKLRQDSEWKVGDTRFDYMMFYCKCSDVDLIPPDSLQEYRPLLPIPDYCFPHLMMPESKPQPSLPRGTRKSDAERSVASGSDRPIRRSMSGHRTPVGTARHRVKSEERSSSFREQDRSRDERLGHQFERENRYEGGNERGQKRQYSGTDPHSDDGYNRYPRYDDRARQEERRPLEFESNNRYPDQNRRPWEYYDDNRYLDQHRRPLEYDTYGRYPDQYRRPLEYYNDNRDPEHYHRPRDYSDYNRYPPDRRPEMPYQEYSRRPEFDYENRSREDERRYPLSREEEHRRWESSYDNRNREHERRPQASHPNTHNGQEWRYSGRNRDEYPEERRGRSEHGDDLGFRQRSHWRSPAGRR